MTTQTIAILSYVGLRILEVAIQKATKFLKQRANAKKYTKSVNIAKVVVNNVITTLNETGATATLDKIKDAALKQVAVKTGLPYQELNEFVDLALDEVKDAIKDILQEDDTVTTTDVNTNTAITQRTPVQ